MHYSERQSAFPRSSYFNLLCRIDHMLCPVPSLSTEHSEGESLFYIISPKDIVVAKERDQDDHIDWLLDKKKYEVSVFKDQGYQADLV